MTRIKVDIIRDSMAKKDLDFRTALASGENVLISGYWEIP